MSNEQADSYAEWFEVTHRDGGDDCIAETLFLCFLHWLYAEDTVDCGQNPSAGPCVVAAGGIVGGPIGKVIGKFLRKLLGKADGAAKPADETAEAATESGPKQGIPPLRQAYVDEVNGLANLEKHMRNLGATSEEIARTLSAQRRSIGIKYKDLTPEPLRSKILARNIDVYGDPLGPTIPWYRGQGFTWEEIIEKSQRTGGKDLGF